MGAILRRIACTAPSLGGSANGIHARAWPRTEVYCALLESRYPGFRCHFNHRYVLRSWRDMTKQPASISEGHLTRAVSRWREGACGRTKPGSPGAIGRGCGAVRRAADLNSVGSSRPIRAQVSPPRSTVPAQAVVARFSENGRSIVMLRPGLRRRQRSTRRITRGMRPRRTAATCTDSTKDSAGRTDSTGISRPLVPRLVPRQKRRLATVRTVFPTRTGHCDHLALWTGFF